MSYYKIIHGFNIEDYIEIEESEVQKAFYCFLMKKDSVFSGGAVKGSLIQAIKPDFHRVMKWNRGYKLLSDDFEELANKGIDRKMQHFLSVEKEKVQYLIQSKQEHLIGTNFEVPKIEASNGGEITKQIESVAEGMRIK